MNSSKKLGLLQRANLLSQKQGLAFCKFVQDNNISKIAVFSLKDNNYYVSNSYNFDAESIVSSKSTLDFWNGLLPVKNRLYFFNLNENNITAILQFFSFKLTDTINSIQILRESDKIFMICNSEISEDLISDLITLDYTFPKNDIDNNSISNDFIISKYILDVNEGIEKFLDSKNISEPERTIFKSSIANEISNRLYFYFSNNHFVSKVDEFKFHIAFKSKESFSEKLMLQHIKTCLQEVLDQYTNSISLAYNQTSSSYSDLFNFLKVE